MKFTQTLEVTREELTMLKGTYADITGMFLSKVGEKDGRLEEIMKDVFGKEIKVDVKTKSKIGKYAFMFHFTDVVEVDMSVEITTKALEKIINLGFAVADLVMPLAVASYEMSNAKDKINAIKAANYELNEMAKLGEGEMKISRNLK